MIALGKTLLNALATLSAFVPAPHSSRNDYQTRIDAASVVALLSTLLRVADASLRTQAAAVLCANGVDFDPTTVLAPALATLFDGQFLTKSDYECTRLWQHATLFLLHRSEFPPPAPSDWRQSVALSCRCVDCAELQRFANDPTQQIGRFRINKERRQHLHRQIDQQQLDMTHITERSSSPQTLSCRKTRRAFAWVSAQYQQDLAALSGLAKIMAGEFRLVGLQSRILAALARRA